MHTYLQIILMLYKCDDKHVSHMCQYFNIGIPDLTIVNFISTNISPSIFIRVEPTSDKISDRELGPISSIVDIGL